LRKLATAAVSTLLGGLSLFAPIASPALAAANPKVAIIVGATQAVTPSYRHDADQVYAEAIKYTTNVVKVYSPGATWAKVQAAVSGASIVVYLGHGNGWPSPYTFDPAYTTKDGFGLNADLNGDGKLTDNENKYYGEPSIAKLKFAPNAVVLLFHLCYASGNSEPGNADPGLATAKQRVDNYASAFLKAGARAVIANGHSQDPYYIRALFTTRQSIDAYWRGAPDFHNHVATYTSSRSPGYTFQMDPESTGKYYRSIAGKMSLNTVDVTGASYASTSGDPSSMVVPGNASPAVDGASVYDSVETAAAGTSPSGTVQAADKVRVEARETTLTTTGAAIYRIHTDGGASGWMRAGDLVPRDSAAPRVWEVDDGAGTFSPNGDGVQDTLPVSIQLSESTDWTLKVKNGDGDTLASQSGTGDTAALTWAPASGSADDGSYAWSLSATDAWGNGPLAASGELEVDTKAPGVTVGGDAGAVPMFTPNGDGSRDSVAFTVGESEPGSVIATVRNAHGDTVDTFSAGVGGSNVSVAWDGRHGSAYVPDGRYEISFAARDRAGNTGAAEVRSVDAYGALGFVTASRVAFFPQDGDANGRTVTFGFRLGDPATVTWTIVDAAGHVVRTFETGEAHAAGTYARGWDGRNDAGHFVARGTYRSVVHATDGTLATSQAVAVVADAFKVSVSDASPGRRQRITVTATSAEALDARPRLAIYQPGIAVYRATMSKVASGVFRVTITLKASHTGTLRLRVYGSDDDGGSQASNLFLPLH
jgi:flagellar hook assembly protein FlgD